MASTVLLLALTLLSARHRAPAGEPLGSRLARPHHPDGWHIPRDEPATPGWPGGKRPPLRDNTTPKET